MSKAMSVVPRALRPLWVVCIVPDIFMHATCCHRKCFQYVFLIIGFFCILILASCSAQLCCHALDSVGSQGWHEG